MTKSNRNELLKKLKGPLFTSEQLRVMIVTNKQQLQRQMWDDLVNSGKDRYYEHLDKKERDKFDLEVMHFVRECGWAKDYIFHKRSYGLTAPIGIMRDLMKRIREMN